MRATWLVVLVACGGGSKGPAPDAAPGDAAPGDAAPDAFVMPLPPATQDFAIAVEVGDSIASTLQASDPNGDALTYSIATPPASGQITSFDPATGAFTYQATVLTAGSDSFTFQVNDGTANAPAPGTVSVTIGPVLFTGHWALTGVQDNGAGCSDSTMRIGHATALGMAPGYFAVSQHAISCGTTTYTFNPARFNITGSNVTDSVMSYSQSAYVSGCGTVTDQFRLARTTSGFDYQETTSVPCFGIGTHVLTAHATRTQVAYLFAEAEATAFGHVYQGDPAVQTVLVRNVGRVPATALAATAPAAPFSFEGGAYPGTTGTCATQIDGLSSCTLAFALDTTTLVDGTGSWSAAYADGVDNESEPGTLSGTVLPKLVNVTAISAGYDFQCALAGGVVCWGAGTSGQTTVPTLSNPTSVSAGGAHACAIDDTGVHCWGDNTSGQTTVPALTSPTMVAAGGNHTCAIDATGVHCWGSNSSGQSTVPALTNPTIVSAGSAHTCALDATGVHCWGYNGNGQTTVPALTNPVAVSAGWAHTCALDATGIHCWGSNTFNVATPPALTSPTAVSAGDVVSCALANGGTVTCWGFNIGTPSLTGATMVSAGYNHACAVVNASARCWGQQTYP